MKRKLLRVAVGLGSSLVLLGATTALAGAQDGPPTIESVQEQVTSVAGSTNLLWIIIGAALVIFMQAGFALVETGMCRAKHAAHVVSTNFAIFGLGFIGFFFVGYGFMFGAQSFAYNIDYDNPIGSWLIGSGESGVLAWATPALSGKGLSAGVLGMFLYMVAFMDTTATIPTGSMAERWKWNSFAVWGLFCGAIYYPLFGAWTWGGGWLSQLGNSAKLGLGYVDFAGSGVVHAAGGMAALAGALVLGPRIGKFDKDGKPRTLPGHHLPMAMLGTFILLFGWFGFNAASTFSASDVRFAVVATNTAIAGAFGAIAAMLWSQMKTGKPDPGMMINGMLAGLVAITAPCAFVSPWAAAVIGVTGSILVYESIGFFERRGIDDPVGAISVHGVGGIYGVLAVGIFANGEYGAGWNLTEAHDGQAATAGVEGLIKGNFGQFGAQLIGAVVLATVIFGVAYAFFYFQNKLTKGGIRSSAADEIAGLDIPEMGVDPYPEFVLRDEPVIELTDRELVRAAQDSEDEKELVTIGKHQ